jgi:hypothetical protein
MNTSSHQDTIARLQSEYGVQTTDSFDGDIVAYHRLDRQLMSLEEFLAAGGQFTRIRLLTDRGCPFMDVSYVYGTVNGAEVRLYDGAIDSYKLGRRTYRSQICAQIKAAGGSYKQAQQAWDTHRYAILWG